MSNPKTFVYKLLTSLGYKVIILDEEGEEYKSLQKILANKLFSYLRKQKRVPASSKYKNYKKKLEVELWIVI